MADNKKLYRYTFYLTGRDDVFVVDADDMTNSDDGNTWQMERNKDVIAELVIKNVLAWTITEVERKQ